MTKYNIKITGLLIYSRILDILTTYVAGSGSLRGETNFLVSVYNLGWFSLLIFNVLFIMISWFFIRKQTEKYYTEAENRLKSASISDLNFTDYFCYLYYSKKVTFVQFLTSAKINYKLLLNTFIHTFIVTVIIVGLIISINNLLNGYGFINLFSFDNCSKAFIYPKMNGF